jgi:hypothetical protein
VRPILIALFAISTFLAGPALAGPREDTLGGISRCAALPDDRTFLDCIYGAVEPMRSELGLPPALAAQQRLVPPADPALARSAAPPSAAPVAAARPPSRDEGIFGGIAGGTSLKMASYSFDKRGLFTVTLSDGSVWRQDTNDTNFAHFSGKASSYPVTVLHGDYGDRLDVRGEPGPYRVVRVR